MSSFVAKSNYREPIEWRERAFETLDQDNYMVDTAIALFAGLGVASFASPVAGIAIGLLMIKRIFDKETQKQKAKDLIVLNGLSAPFLEGDDFHDFVEQAGQDAVYQELKFAESRDVEFSDRAWEFLEAYEQQQALPQAEREGWALYPPEPVDAARGMGSDVRQTPMTTPTTSTAQAIPSNPSSRASRTLIDVIADDLKSSFFSAPTRVGKGVTVAAAIREVQHRYRGIRVWAMTPKQDPHEFWYWETVEQFYNPDIENGSPLRAAIGIYQFIREYAALKRDRNHPTLLVVDELPRLVGLLRNIKMKDVDPELFQSDERSFSDWFLDRVMFSASMSQSVGYYVWVLTPKNTIGGKGFNKDDVVGAFRVYTLASKTNLTFADGGTGAFCAPRIDIAHPVFTQAQVVGYSREHRQWYPVPNYKAISDKRTDVDAPVKLTNVWLPSFSTEMIQQFDTATMTVSKSTDVPQPQNEISTDAAIMKAVYRAVSEAEKGCKLRDVQRRNFAPLKNIKSEDLKFYLEVMVLEHYLRQEGDIYYHNPDHQP
ncbi:hypothetical protein LEP3755_35940 [Leptolyngbya sp. NIES-3755]|nr:hypothetical protein LEP3755_35940 [Leptolyngbya sp. NIES-3755]